MILKDFAKLWVGSLKDLLYMRYFIGLLQLFKTFSKTLVKEFALLQSFRLLPEPFIRARSKKSVTRDTKLFAKIVHGCRMWIWNLDMAGFVKWPLFIWIQYFVVVSKNKLQNNNNKKKSYPPFNICWYALLQTQHYVNNFVQELITFS